MQRILLSIALLAAISNGQYIRNGVVNVKSQYYDLAIDIKADIGY